MQGTWGIDPGWGVTAVRLATGIILLVAGWAKFMVGTEALTASFTKMAIPAPGIAGPFIMLLEVTGGAMLILGAAVRWVGLIFTIEFIVATFYVKLPIGFAGARLDLMILAASFLLFVAGAGRLAVDEVWLDRPAVTAARRVA